jgi:hypothetical protein
VFQRDFGSPSIAYDICPLLLDAVRLHAVRLNLTPLGAVGTQVALLHSPLLQSLPLAHFFPFAQPAQPAPQSRSDSAPFNTPSEQLAVVHERLAPSQIRLAQSLFTLHGALPEHGAQEPPQSTPVSVPFLIWSAQLALTQISWKQLPFRQSEAFEQGCPFGQGSQEPPQSVADSSPLWVPSVHDAA